MLSAGAAETTTTGALAVAGSYVSTSEVVPTTIRQIIESAGTTQMEFDLDYRCVSTTTVTAAQLMPYERRGYVKCSSELASKNYGRDVGDLFTAVTASPGTHNQVFLNVFQGQADDAATDVTPMQVLVELTQYVEWVDPVSPAASNV